MTIRPGGDSTALPEYVAKNRDKLSCDYAVISDTSQFAPGMPAVTYGLKGLAYFEIAVKGKDSRGADVPLSSCTEIWCIPRLASGEERIFILNTPGSGVRLIFASSPWLFRMSLGLAGMKSARISSSTSRPRCAPAG